MQDLKSQIQEEINSLQIEIDKFKPILKDYFPLIDKLHIANLKLKVIARKERREYVCPVISVDDYINACQTNPEYINGLLDKGSIHIINKDGNLSGKLSNGFYYEESDEDEMLMDDLEKEMFQNEN